MRSAFLLVTIAALGVAPAASQTPKPKPTRETAVLAGGCFWGVEAVFEHVKGVRDVVSGYAGGAAKHANYQAVSGERTRHAEVVRISYDPAEISYRDLLHIFFTVAHDPTQLNRQGPDVGPSYRSAIFPQNEEQKKIATAAIAALGKRGGRPVVTRIESGTFYKAEALHQDFARRNPRHPYIVAYDAPKIRALKAAFPTRFKS